MQIGCVTAGDIGVAWSDQHLDLGAGERDASRAALHQFPHDAEVHLPRLISHHAEAKLLEDDPVDDGYIVLLRNQGLDAESLLQPGGIEILHHGEARAKQANLGNALRREIPA